MKNRSKVIELKNYDCSVTFILSDHACSTVKNLFKKYDQMDRWELEGTSDDNFSGFAFDATFNNYFFIFNMKYPIDHNTITHEIWHLTNYIFDARVIREDKDHENGAWLAGYLAQEAYKFLEERKIKVI